MLKFITKNALFGYFGLSLGVLLTTTSPNTPNSLQLVQVQIIARHGTRTPMNSKNHPPKFSEWPVHCVSNDTYPSSYIVTPTQTILYDEYKKKSSAEGKSEKFTNSCGYQQLTNLGMSQMEKFGALLRERYVERLGFLNDQFDGESIWIRSSATSRTILTAQYIMEGLYPKGKRKNNETIKINVKPQPEENMYPSYSCAKFTNLKNLYMSSPEHKQVKSNSKEILSKVEGDTDDIKFWTSRSVSGAVNDLNTIIDHDLPLPKGLSYLDFEALVKQSGKIYQGLNSTDEIKRLGIGRFIKDIVGNIEIAVQSPTDPSNPQPHPKLFLYAGHDNTLGPLLSALEVFDGKHPRMGSAMIVELWKNTQNKFFFQLMFYDPQEGVKDLIFPSCNTNLCPLNILLDRAKCLIPLDYINECLEDHKTSGN